MNFFRIILQTETSVQRRCLLCAVLIVAFLPAARSQTFEVLLDDHAANYPRAGLVQGSDGDFYGTASSGGSNGYGTIFKITASGTHTLLHSFDETNGSSPYGGLVQGSDGDFYGTTLDGGSSHYGTIFKISASGTYTLLHSFNNTNGSYPCAGLVQGSNGDFYGTAQFGGALGFGTVFKISASGSFTLLHSFDATNGQSPFAGLVEGSDGDFYGTTQFGGALGFGTVFKISASGSFTLLHSFDSTNGAYPTAALVQGGDGDFYGTTLQGGAGNYGTVFKIDAAGSFTSLYTFDDINGRSPRAGLVEGSDGYFYGTTQTGGAGNHGTIFKISSGGAHTVQHFFDGSPATNPSGTPVFGRDGVLYGTANPMVVWRLADDGAALAFDGGSETVTIDGHAEFNTSTFTVEGWVKPGSGMAPWSRLWGTENNQGDLIVKTDGENRFAFAPKINGQFQYLYAPTEWTVDQWYHVAGVVDVTEIRLFVNGVLVASRPNPGTWAGDAGDRFIGRATAPTPPNRLRGQVDEVRYWNYARNAAQINQARTGELTGAETGLVAYYKFNQGVAVGDNTAITTVTDSANDGDHPGALSGFDLTFGNSTSNFVAPGAVESGDLAPVPTFADIEISGNGVRIWPDDTTPQLADHTDFGLTSVPVTRTFTIANTGSLPLEVTGIALSGPAAADFTLGGFSAGTVGAGTSETFTVSVGITNGFTRQATVTVSSDDEDQGSYAFAIQSMPAIEVTTTGNEIVISNQGAAGGTLTLSQPAAGQISITSTEHRLFTIDGGAYLEETTGGLSLAGINQITFNGAPTGDDVINISSCSDLPILTINAGQGDDQVNFTGAVGFLSGAALEVDLQDDDAAPGIDSITLSAGASVQASGAGTITFRASKNITLAAGSILETEDGDLVLEANQQLLPTAGNFMGVEISGGHARAIGTGGVTIKGRGGNSAGGGQIGVCVQNGGDVTGGTSSPVSVQGTGGTSAGAANFGVLLRGVGSTLTTGGCDAALEGTEGGGATGYALVIHTPVVINSAGDIALIGNSMTLQTGATVTASGTATVRPGAGVGIALGSAAGTIGGPLALTDAELDCISASTLQIGAATSGAIAQTASITRSAPTDTVVTSGGDIAINGGTFASGGGDLTLDAGGVVTPASAGVDVNVSGGSLSFGGGSAVAASINGAVPNSGYRVLKVMGSVDLTGASLLLSGVYVPLPGQSFVIVDNDGVDPVTGTFAGLAPGSIVTFNGVPLAINYAGGDSNDVVLSYATPVLTVAKAAVTVVEGGIATNSGTFKDLQDNLVSVTSNIGNVTLNFGNETWNWSYNAADGPAGPDTVTITATDGSTPPLTVSRSFSLKVTNAAPAAQAQTVAVGEDTGPTSITLVANEPGVDDLTYSIVTPPPAAKGTLGAVTGNQVSFTPAANFAGSTFFTFKATDSDGAVSNTATVTVNVSSDNDPPVFVKGSDKVHPASTTAAQSFVGWATGIGDGDPDLAQTVTFNVTEVGASGIFTTAPAISSTGTLTYEPNGTSGAATLSVSLTDSGGATSPAQTFTITVASFSPGTYTGLAHPALGTTPGQYNLGLFSGALTGAGGFTGKVNFGGTVTGIVTSFSLSTGNATGANPTLSWNLHLDLFGGTDKITGTVTQLASGDVCEIDADRATFNATNPVPAQLLNGASTGIYTLVFAAEDQAPPVDIHTYPQGDGFGRITLNATGTVSLSGTLADGTLITASAPLSKAHQWPLAALIKTTATTVGVTFGGVVQFDPTQPATDVSATDLHWFRPASGAAKNYAAGWPAGITVDAFGALYTSGINVQTTLGLDPPNPVTGNGKLAFTLGKLTSPIDQTNFNITANTVSKLPASDTSFSLALAPATGNFSGTFTPNWTPLALAKPTFKGILIQKGASKGGYGFFLSNVKDDPDPESGSVTLGAP